MSYDVEVFTVERPTPPGPYQRRNWQIAVHGPSSVEAEDVPAQLRAVLPGLQFLTQFHLEGAAPASAVTRMLTMARSVAKSARGIVVDLQEDTIETPRGVRRLQIETEKVGRGIVELSWFVEDTGPLSRVLSGELLDLFQRIIPEILPRRYGLYEPLQFKLASEGIDHLRGFIREHLHDYILWRCQRPCLHVLKEIPDRVGVTRQGFRCGRLTLKIDSAVAADRAWRVELARLWLSVADLVHPFYAEIRLGRCPTQSWWWRGIPTPAPSALLLGRPYDDLWKEFASTARLSDAGFRYLEHFVEISGDGRAAPMPSPPDSIVQPAEPERQTVFDMSKPEDIEAMRASIFTFRPPQYPVVWSFEQPQFPSPTA